MKKIIITTFISLSAVIICLGAALGNYTSSLSGQQRSAAKDGDIVLDMTARGDLSGGFNISIKQSNSTISGGEWSIVVIEKNDDDTDREAGTLKGTISSGSIIVNDETKRVSSAESQLTITEGTGRYAGATGTGIFNTSAATVDSHELSGTLSFNF